jgi:fructokinase
LDLSRFLRPSTGAVHIQLGAEGKSSYEFLANTAWDHLEWNDELAELAARTNAVCFGTLGQRSDKSGQAIRRFVTSTPRSCLRIFDTNLRPPFYADLSEIAKGENKLVAITLRRDEPITPPAVPEATSNDSSNSTPQGSSRRSVTATLARHGRAWRLLWLVTATCDGYIGGA